MNKISVNVINSEEISSELGYVTRDLNLNVELITSFLIKLYCAKFLFIDQNKDAFNTITNYIYVEKDTEEYKQKEYNKYDVEKYVFIKETEKEVENDKWICINLVFEVILFLTDPDSNYESFKKFLSNIQTKFNSDEIKIDDIDILLIYILYTKVKKLNSQKNTRDILELLYNEQDYSLDIIFEYNKLQKEKFLDDYSEKVYSKYLNFLKINENENKFFMIFENNLLKYNEIINSSCFKKISKLSYKEDTNIEIKLNFFSSFDIFEIFNKTVPNDFIPFINIKDFNKILSNFKIPNEWIEELVDKKQDNYLNFYVLNQDEQDIKNKIKPNDKNYSKCFLKEIKRFEGNFATDLDPVLYDLFENKTYFQFELNIQVLNNKVKKRKDKDDLILRVLNNLPLITKFKEVEISEKINKGIIMYNLLKPLNYVNIPIIQHFFMLDNFSSFFMLLEQQYTIDRKRGGEPLYLFVNNILESLVLNKNYLYLYDNFDCKLNLYYDKIGKQSLTKINFPINFEKVSDKPADVLLFKYSKNRLNSKHLKKILDVLVCYITNEDNINDVKEEYEYMFENF